MACICLCSASMTVAHQQTRIKSLNTGMFFRLHALLVSAINSGHRLCVAGSGHVVSAYCHPPRRVGIEQDIVSPSLGIDH